MQEHFRFTLFIIGICIIGGILLHGMWSIRQNSKKSKRNTFESRNWEPDFEHEDDLEEERPIFDDVGVSRARIIRNPQAAETNTEAELSMGNIERSERANMNADLEAIKLEDNDLEENGHKSVVSNRASHTENLASSIADDDLQDSTQKASSSLNTDRQSIADESINDGFSPSQLSEAALNKGLSDTLARSLDNEEQRPVYSNVVTQPKPEFNKAAGTKREPKDPEFGQPPEFLLKRSEGETKPSEAQMTSKGSSNPADKPTVPSPDFSLNIQEGPKFVESTKKNSPSEHALQKPHDDVEKRGVEKELSFAEQAKRFVRRNKKTVADKIRKEPVLKNGPSDDQMRIDFDNSQAGESAQSENPFRLNSERSNPNRSSSDDNQNRDQGENPSQKAEKASQDAQSSSAASDVLVLNVRASNDKPIEGAALLPMLLTLGFKFGEHDIFHRHVNTNGKGPILFSLTNMFKPGVFDIDNLENFSTLGISLFMMLPIEGDAQQVFNMMHNAARKLSDEFSCRILDGNKVALSKQSLQQYVERIREFERKRINR